MKNLLRILAMLFFYCQAYAQAETQYGSDIEQYVLFDFRKNDGSNANVTSSPDAYGNYWNSVVYEKTPCALANSENMVSDITINTKAFESNGIQYGALLDPAFGYLEELAIATATQDYFFTQSTSSFTIGGLNGDSEYEFSLFGTRNTAADRASQYILAGVDSFTGTLQTSGADLGGAGYHGNNSTVLTSETITSDAEDRVLLNLSVVEGGVAYKGLLKKEEYKPNLEQEPICESQDDLLIAVMGSSVARGTGATDDRGYAYQYTQILSQRSVAQKGLDWDVANISIGGNNTNNVLDRWETDLERLCGSYVIYGLSLGNEGIKEGGQSIFDQWRDNMLILIEMAREKGIEPIVTNCYARNDFSDVEYNFTKEMNILIHQWDVASLNVLGAVEDGAGKWAPDHFSDGFHPNNEGHLEMAYAMVPSLFDALAAGKPQPEKVDDTFLTLSKSDGKQFEFSLDNTLHSFTTSFDIKTTFSGVLSGYKVAGGEGLLMLDESGHLSYMSSNSSVITNNTTVLNDGQWHKITLSHYYALGETLLYVDGLLQGVINEKLVVKKIFIGGKLAPSQADYREWHLYRAGMTINEIKTMTEGVLLKSSLELYAPLDGQAVIGSNPLVNLAQSMLEVEAIAVEIDSLPLSIVENEQIQDLYISLNPVSATLRIKFSIEEESQVRVFITDLTGRLITVISDEQLSQGSYSLVWDNARQSSDVGDDIYLCNVQIGDVTQVEKVIFE